MEIRLDRETFKALASETRVDILKLLGERRHMQSEIASVLSLSVPTVKEHLEALGKAGLVERHDEGRKWKYYSLTKKGKGVLQPEEMKIWIVLGLFVFSLVGGVVTAFRTLFAQQDAFGGEARMAMEATTLEAADAAPKLAMAPVEQVAPAISPWFIGFCVVTLVLAVILIYLFVRRAQYKKELGKYLIKK